MTFELIAANWTDLTASQQAQFISLVKSGGEVNPYTLESLLGRARKLAFASDSSGDVQAVAALKTPNPSYRAKVFAKARLSEQQQSFEFELGWIFVAPDARGHRLGERLSQLLLQDEPAATYATSADDSDHWHVHKMLKRLGFREVRSTYTGTSGRMIKMFLRQ